MDDSPCKGCKKRVVGCRSTCTDWLTYNVLKQPEKERIRQEKRKCVLIKGDKMRRIEHMKNAKRGEESPTKCRKR